MTFRARFNGQALIPDGALELPQGSVVEIRAGLAESPAVATSALQELAKLADPFRLPVRRGD